MISSQMWNYQCSIQAYNKTKTSGDLPYAARPRGNSNTNNCVEKLLRRKQGFEWSKMALITKTVTLARGAWLEIYRATVILSLSFTSLGSRGDSSNLKEFATSIQNYTIQRLSITCMAPINQVIIMHYLSWQKQSLDIPV